MLHEKGQSYGQIFIYILTIVVVSFILVYGYNSIQSFKQRAEQVSCLKFKNDLTNAIEMISSEFGSVIRKDLHVCNNYPKVCFVESIENQVLPSNIDPIIKDSVLSNTGRNVFLVENTAKDSFYAGKISVEPDLLCIKTVSGKVSLRIEGKGNHVLISPWD